jgi:hypothetical protein
MERKILMTERPDQVLRKWEELNEMKKNESAVLKVFAKLERRQKPKSKSKPKGKKK